MQSIKGCLRLLLTTILLLAGALAARVLLPAVPSDSRKQWQMAWARATLAAMGVSLRQEGKGALSPNCGTLLVANHISFVDILAVACVAPASFVSKSDVANWPLLGYMAKQSGTIFITRGSATAARRTHESIADRLRTNEIVTIFPEGTTSDGTGVLPFHAALFQAAIDANAHVACLRLGYADAESSTSQRPAYIGTKSLTQCLWDIVTSPGLTVTIHWLTTLTEQGANRRQLAAHAHRIISHAVTK